MSQATIDVRPLCGKFGHERGFWSDQRLGLWWCPDCGYAAFAVAR